MITVEKVSLPTLVTRLLQEARDVARAEFELAKAKLLSRAKSMRTAAILFVAALVIALTGLTGLVLGLVLALVPLVGAALAGIIVFVSALVIAGVLGWFGARQLSAKDTPAETKP